MTHDHGLIPVKYLGVEHGVNVTLGLPFVRATPTEESKLEQRRRLLRSGGRGWRFAGLNRKSGSVNSRVSLIFQLSLAARGESGGEAPRPAMRPDRQARRPRISGHI